MWSKLRWANSAMWERLRRGPGTKELKVLGTEGDMPGSWLENLVIPSWSGMRRISCQFRLDNAKSYRDMWCNRKRAKESKSGHLERQQRRLHAGYGNSEISRSGNPTTHSEKNIIFTVIRNSKSSGRQSTQHGAMTRSRQRESEHSLFFRIPSSVGIYRFLGEPVTSRKGWMATWKDQWRWKDRWQAETDWCGVHWVSSPVCSPCKRTPINKLPVQHPMTIKTPESPKRGEDERLPTHDETATLERPTDIRRLVQTIYPVNQRKWDAVEERSAKTSENQRIHQLRLRCGHNLRQTQRTEQSIKL